MFSFGILTLQADDSYTLPITKEFNRPMPVNLNDNSYPKEIWRKWSNTQLLEIGCIRIERKSYDGQTYRVLSWDEEIIDNHLVRTPVLEDFTSEQPTEVQIQKRLNEVRNYRNSIASAGILWSPDSNITEFKVSTDFEAQQNFGNAKQWLDISQQTSRKWNVSKYIYEIDPNGIKTYSFENHRISLSTEVFITLAVQVAQHVEDCFEREHDLNLALSVATTIAILREIDITLGWPETAPTLDDKNGE